MILWVLRLGAVGAVAVLGVLGASTASADPPDGPAYAQHVRDCSQTMGFNGVHNPGMHQGISGWDPTHVC